MSTGSAAPIAQTSLGEATGITLDSGVCAFLGVPYAEPPVGVLRFAPPRPVKSWPAAGLDATTVGATPPQLDHARLHLYPPMGEDCLWLNVWTPSPDAGDRPVMVWIHGGGWLEEGACDPLYSGAPLAARGDVVVVSIEYRTNVFGFGNLNDVDGSGNAGILDQLAGLRWVQAHIGAFGGNPDNVTIFGESAGGMSVSALFGMPAAEGLFDRAIMQSNVASTIRRPDFAAAVTSRIAATAGCTASAVDLRDLQWQRLLEAAATTAESSPVSPDLLFGPVQDGVVFGDTPLRTSAAGLNAALPILLGFTRDESRYWQDLDESLADPDLPPELLLDALATPALPDGASIQDLVDMLWRNTPEGTSPLHVGLAGIDDAYFRMPIIRAAERHSQLDRAAAYLYCFDWEPSVPAHPEFDYGAPHAAELGFALGTAGACPEMYGDSWPEPLVDQMMDAWLAFARSGDPNHSGLPTWPTYDIATREVMVFNAGDTEPTSAVEADPDGERRRFWDGVPFDGTRPALDPAAFDN